MCLVRPEVVSNTAATMIHQPSITYSYHSAKRKISGHLLRGPKAIPLNGDVGGCVQRSIREVHNVGAIVVVPLIGGMKPGSCRTM